MLPGILTTALEIIIILDICGAVVYFALTGLSRSNGDGNGGKTASFSDPLLPCPVDGIPVSTVPYSMNVPAIPIYAGPAVGPEPDQGNSLMAGFRRKIVSLQEKLNRVPSVGQEIKKVNMGSEQKRLSQILDSFREEL